MIMSQKKPAKRRDPTGHLELNYERKLRGPSRDRRETEDSDANAFVPIPHSEEEHAERRGEAFVQAATSGEGAENETRDQFDEGEVGGPFTLSSGSEEFAEGTDESNIPEATREPLPKTSKADP
ncbi:MAG TPA: hypothetical protein VGI10_07040 [Polyangiaceae bacterium]|jgi:hypothetical protein